MITWVFPGQGSQFVGMGSGLEKAAAREVFETASKVLGYDIRAVCLHGPEELLHSTEVSQPAILTVSVAAAWTLETSGQLPDLVAGHSVGEFAALVAARTMSFEDALHVVRVRAEAMAAAGRLIPGRMVAVIGLPRPTVAELCEREPGVVDVATVNGADQVVVSGALDAVENVSKAARAAGARRVIPLSVSVAAHSRLMTPAADAVRVALDRVTLLPPVVPFASGVTGRILNDAEQIADSLVDALTGAIDWVACTAALRAAGADVYVEVGPGRVLTGLIHRIVPDARIYQAGDDLSVSRLAVESASGVRP